VSSATTELRRGTSPRDPARRLETATAGDVEPREPANRCGAKIARRRERGSPCRGNATQQGGAAGKRPANREIHQVRFAAVGSRDDGFSAERRGFAFGSPLSRSLLTDHFPPKSAHPSFPASTSQRRPAPSAVAAAPAATTVPFSIFSSSAFRSTGVDPEKQARTSTALRPSLTSSSNFAVALRALSARPGAPMAPSAASDARTQGAPRSSATQVTEDAAARRRGGVRGVPGRSGAGSHFPPAITGSGSCLFHPYNNCQRSSHPAALGLPTEPSRDFPRGPMVHTDLRPTDVNSPSVAYARREGEGSTPSAHNSTSPVGRGENESNPQER
jgi:hypothetical protein